jgi:hypothetical protein
MSRQMDGDGCAEQGAALAVAIPDVGHESQGKTVPGAVLLAAVGRSAPGGAPLSQAGENPGSGLRRAGSPRPWAAKAALWVGAGFESEGRHLVLLIADAQREVMQGVANDGIGAVTGAAVRAVPPHKHRGCAGEVIRQLQQSAGGSSVVSSGDMVRQHSVS